MTPLLDVATSVDDGAEPDVLDTASEFVAGGRSC
jgi:hypothetical protein